MIILHSQLFYIHHFHLHVDHMHLDYPENNFQKHCFQFLLGITVIPRGNEIKEILGRWRGGGGNQRAFGFTCMCKIIA